MIKTKKNISRKLANHTFLSLSSKKLYKLMSTNFSKKLKWKYYHKPTMTTFFLICSFKVGPNIQDFWSNNLGLHLRVNPFFFFRIRNTDLKKLKLGRLKMVSLWFFMVCVATTKTFLHLSAGIRSVSFKGYHSACM